MNNASTATAAQDDTRTGDKKGPKDVLFFMRDKKSMTDLRAVSWSDVYNSVQCTQASSIYIVFTIVNMHTD